MNGRKKQPRDPSHFLIATRAPRQSREGGIKGRREREKERDMEIETERQPEKHTQRKDPLLTACEGAEARGHLP